MRSARRLRPAHRFGDAAEDVPPVGVRISLPEQFCQLFAESLIAASSLDWLRRNLFLRCRLFPLRGFHYFSRSLHISILGRCAPRVNPLPAPSAQCAACALPPSGG